MARTNAKLQRMYQSAGLLHGDEILVPSMDVADIDRRVFSEFYEKQYEELLDEQVPALNQIMRNLNLSRDGVLNIAGALLFGKNTALKLPAFIVKCVAYPGSDIDVDEYSDSQDISGVLKNVFDDTLGFILRNIKRKQNNP